MDSDAMVPSTKPLPPEPLCSPTGRTLVECHVCGVPAQEFHAFNLELGRDRWGYTRMSPGGAKVFVGRKHFECLTKTTGHAVRYFEVSGNPGSFPLLCGPCEHRRGTACGHPLRGKGELRAAKSKERPLDVVGCSGRRAA